MSSPLPKLILHVGTHKTGTTTIQHLLHANRQWLAQQGIHYFPDYIDGRLRNNNHELARHLADGLTPALASLIQERTERNAINLVSSESFHRNVHGHHDWQGHLLPDAWQKRQRFLADTARAFETFDVTVLLWIRRADEYAESLYGTIVRGGNTKLTFEEFVRSGSILFDYAKHVACLREHFKDVRVFPYRRSGMRDSFFSETGLPKPPIEVERANTTPDARLVHWAANWVRHRETNIVDIEMRKRFIRAPEQARLFEDSGAVSLWRDDNARIEFAENSEAGLSRDFFHDERKKKMKTFSFSRTEQQQIDASYREWEERNERLRRRVSGMHGVEYQPRHRKSFSFPRLFTGRLAGKLIK